MFQFPTVRLSTANVGSAPAWRFERFVQDHEPTAIALQEMSDRQDLIEVLHRLGYLTLVGDEPGQPATILAYNPQRVTRIRAVIILLMLSREWGQGAGGKRMKTKWYYGQRFQIKGFGWRSRFTYGSAHMPPSQGEPLRRKIAVAMVKKMVAGLRKRRRPVMIGMDSNTTPAGASLEAMRDAGYQRTPGLPTHGKHWNPDGIWWLGKGMRLVECYTVEFGSDHRAVVADYRRVWRRFRR
jgi:hypothetical protein